MYSLIKSIPNNQSHILSMHLLEQVFTFLNHPLGGTGENRMLIGDVKIPRYFKMSVLLTKVSEMCLNMSPL